MDYKRRRRDLAVSMSKEGLSGFLVTSYEGRRYLSGFTAEDLGCRESSGVLLVLEDDTYLFTDGRYELQAKSETKDIHILIYKEGVHQVLPEIVRTIGLKRIGFEASSISVERFNEIRKVLLDCEFVQKDTLITDLRSRKEPGEIDAIRRSVRALERCFEEVLNSLRTGLTEKEVEWVILESIYRYSEGPSFSPIVASGPNSALPHAAPKDRRLQEGEPIIIDMGVKIEGYCSDMTRTAFIGGPGDRFREIYSIVKEAKERAQEVIRAGMTGREADQVARKVIEAHGYGKYFTHALGHGVGLSVHEAPTLSPRNKKGLPAGSVVTVEPGIYLPGEGGVRLEDMVVVQEHGIEPLGTGKWIYDL